jgi:hypothetical protein
MALEAPVLERSAVSDPPLRNLQARIRTEFNEMPGLKLTLPQASRLFSVDAGVCAKALVRLVAAGMLSVDEGSFVRRDVRLERRGPRRTGW